MNMTGGMAERLLHAAEGAFRLLGLRERRCAACGEPFEPGGRPDGPDPEAELARLFCPACRGRLRRRTAGFCPYCGEPSLLEDAPCMPCEHCLRTLPPWREFMFFGVYGGLLRDLVLRAKFGGSLAVLDALGRVLAAVCAEHYAVCGRPDVIVPMPLDRARLRGRGFNQCREMVRHVSSALNVPVRADMLVKPLALTPQSLLNREQRSRMEQPFAAGCRADGVYVLLVDDICTTGATLERAAECLLAAGAARVDAAVLARASRYEPHGAGGVPALP